MHIKCLQIQDCDERLKAVVAVLREMRRVNIGQNKKLTREFQDEVKVCGAFDRHLHNPHSVFSPVGFATPWVCSPTHTSFVRSTTHISNCQRDCIIGASPSVPFMIPGLQKSVRDQTPQVPMAQEIRKTI
jgi:hypothetical protein